MSLLRIFLLSSLLLSHSIFFFFFFFNDTATTEIYTLSLHDALPISWPRRFRRHGGRDSVRCPFAQKSRGRALPARGVLRSEEHTSELQSHSDLVCRLLLLKKKKKKSNAKNSMTHTDADMSE